jgi:hypothetical protein
MSVHFSEEQHKVKSELRKARGMLKNLARYGVDKVPIVEVPQIPKDFEFFQQTADKWAKVEFPKGIDITSCVYIFSPPAEFPWHRHLYDELIIGIEGSLKVSYYNEQDVLIEKVVNKNESIFIKKGLRHKATALTKDTTIQCNWSIKIDGWVGEFELIS